jgi:serine/threonine protein kinase
MRVMAQGVPYLSPGTKLGRYELRRMLAVGGMAELHLARATGIEGFQKLVVLKRILPHLADDPEFVRLFLDEARLAATLHHPNVVEVFDIGSHEGSYFFTMEYVRGQDLGSVITAARKRGEGLLLENALAIVIGVAEGLHHAHEMRDAAGQPLGVVHRDVSPSNVMLTYAGAVKLCDFGIAKAVARQARTDGNIKGKVSYLSPEQCRGEALDRRSDVFALGVVLYELTVGKRLFRGPTELDIMKQITERPIAAPTSLSAEYPLALEEIVMRALERDPAKRYATAQELQLALEEFARDERLLISSTLLATWMTELFPEASATAIDRDNTPLPGAVTAHEAGSAPPPRRRGLIVGAVAGVTLAGVLVYAVARDRSPPSASHVEPAVVQGGAPPTPTTTTTPPVTTPLLAPPPATTPPAPAIAVEPTATVTPATAPKRSKAKPKLPATTTATPVETAPTDPVSERPPLQ